MCTMGTSPTTRLHDSSLGSHDGPIDIVNGVHKLLNNLDADRPFELVFSEYDPQK